MVANPPGPKKSLFDNFMVIGVKHIFQDDFNQNLPTR